MSPQDERLLLNHAKMPAFLDSWRSSWRRSSWTPGRVLGGEEFNLGPETRLDCSKLLCNKVLLKYKGDRESF